MACNQQSDCTGQESCVDGQCVEMEIPKERKVRRTFATARGEYVGQIKGEQQMLEDFGDFLTDQLDEATAERAEQQENTGFWGTVGSIAGFAIGCYLGGPGGCVKGATIGAGIGSLGGRTAADYLDDAESYGLTEEEFAKLDPAQLKYLKGTHEDLLDDARDMQADLDSYDKNEWKQHVLGAIGDTWSAYKMASFGEVLWEGGEKLFKEGAEEGIKDLLPAIDVPQFNPTASIDPIPTLLDSARSGTPLFQEMA